MAQRGKGKPAKVKLFWDGQYSPPPEDEQLPGLLLYTDDAKKIVGGVTHYEGNRWPDHLQAKDLERIVSNVQDDQRQALLWIGTQILELMPLLLSSEVTDSPDADFHLVITRSGTHFTFDLEVPEIVGEKGDKGDKGDTGDTGATGATGPQGEKGDQGDDAVCDDCPPPQTNVPTPTNPEGTTDDDVACRVAAAVTLGFKSYVDQIKEKIALGQLLYDVASVIIAAIAALLTDGAALPALVAAVTALVNFIIDNIDDTADILADDDFWHSIQCSIYCAVKPAKDIDETYRSEVVSAVLGNEYVSVTFDAPGWRTQMANWFSALPIAALRQNALLGAQIEADCSDCMCADVCNEHWNVLTGFGDFFGSFTDPDDIDLEAGSITFHFTGKNGDNRWYLDFRTDDSSTCCKVDHIVLNGSTPESYNINQAAWQNCGETFADSGAFTTGVIDGHCINHFQLRFNDNSEKPDSVTIFFIPC